LSIHPERHDPLRVIFCIGTVKFVFVRQLPILNVGAAISRPAGKSYVFALVFGEFEMLYCTGVLQSAANFLIFMIAGGNHTFIL
jgi:hypothetical protein